MTNPLFVSVILPTIGRPRQLRACLESLAACDPRANEIVVVDSSTDGEVAALVERFKEAGARHLRCDRLGLGTAFNTGIRDATHEILLFTNDDCTVEPSWVGAGAAALAAHDEAIVSGRVRPRGDPAVVPSTIDDPEPKDLTGEIRMDGIYTQAMAVRRSSLLDFGGFDETIRPAAEDNDLCYRWLRAGRALRYEPAFTVWHEDWRTPKQMEELYVAYWRGAGTLYAKYLRRRDLTILRFLARDLYGAVRGAAGRVLKGNPRWRDQRRGITRGFPGGFLEGWRAARPRR